MKRIVSISATIMLLIILVISSCKKQELQKNEKNQNYVLQGKTFPKIDSEILEKEVYSALDFFTNVNCDADITQVVNEYYVYNNIKQGDCDRTAINEYYNILNNDKSTSKNAFEYLLSNKYISKEGYLVLIDIENRYKKKMLIIIN